MAFASKLERERDDSIKAITAFCEASQWGAKDWKDQDHIKPMFDIYNKATAGKGDRLQKAVDSPAKPDRI